MAKFSRASATQVKAFKSCQRLWYYGWVDKIKTPPTEAMLRGTDIHSANEHYLKTGKVPKGDFENYVRALIPFLPHPGPHLFVERSISMSCGNGVSWVGFVDVVNPKAEPLLLRDHKSTSDFRYALTPEEIAKDTQVNSYAEFFYQSGYVGPIDAGLLYVQTSKTPPKSPPKAMARTTILTRTSVEEVWGRDMETVAEMAKAAQASSAQDLPPTTTLCGNLYGKPCPHIASCGLLGTDLFSIKTNKKEGSTMGNAFLERLKNKGAANGTNGSAKPALGAAKPKTVAKAPVIEDVEDETEEVAEVAPARKPVSSFAARKTLAKVPTGVLPPDAAPRETPIADPEEVEAAEAAPKKRGRPKKTETTDKARGKEFVLYIDCLPTKGGGDLEPTLLEDWVNPIIMALNETAMQESQLPHWQLLPYSQEKACLALAVQERLESLPPSLLVNSSNNIARDVLPLLIPHATQVVRALRG